MASYRFPNETDEYRARRDELLDLEVELRAQTEAVAQKRRELPPGGQLAEDYRFQKAGGSGEVREVPFAELFGPHDTLLLYSMMFGADWDAPCPSCTSIVDGFNANHHSVGRTASMAVVAAAGPEQLAHWAKGRGWTINLVSGIGNRYLLDYSGYPNAEKPDPAMVSIMNVFRKTPKGIFHFWGSELLSRPFETGHPRHVDPIWMMWNLLDLTPEGRGDAVVPLQNFEHAYFSKHVLGEGG